MTTLPRFYPIIDAGFFAASPDPIGAVANYACEIVDGGATLLQFRSKQRPGREMLSQARELRRVLGRVVRVIMNDRADLCLAAGFDGVHLGQDDLSVDGARLILGDKLIGLSTHNPEQVSAASLLDLDYIAIGPVFTTSTKANADPVIGLDGIKAARMLTTKPLVAIGGITRTNCRSVIEAGADSAAVISDLLQKPREATKEFLRILS